MKRILSIVLIVNNAVACEMESRLSSIDMISNMDVNVGEKIVLEISHTPADAIVPAYHFKSNNCFVATVNDQGVVVCHHAGTCTITVATADTRFSTSCTIHVKPNNNLFSEPTLEFNLSKTEVKLKESNSTILYETATMLIYQGDKYPVQQVAYQFDENKKLVTSAIKLSANISSELTDFMIERYDYIPTAEKVDLSIWRGGNMEIATKMIDNSCFVIYSPFLGNSTSESARKLIDTIRNICK